MVSNGSYHYDHDRDGTHTAIDGCEAGFRLAEHDTFIAIRYERNRLMASPLENMTVKQNLTRISAVSMIDRHTAYDIQCSTDRCLE